MRTLVVHEETETRERVRGVLAPEGIVVDEAADWPTAAQMLRLTSPDLLVTAPLLQDVDVLAAISLERRAARIAIIALIPDDLVALGALALDRGADDYVRDSEIVSDLASHVHAVLRRTTTDEQPRLVFGDLEIDVGAREVRVGGHDVALTRREFDLLTFFALRPRSVLAHHLLLECVWGGSGDSERRATLTEHVRRVRGKLAVDGDPRDRWLHTVRGVGYVFRP
jgi:two-component system response regulator MprA